MKWYFPYFSMITNNHYRSVRYDGFVNLSWLMYGPFFYENARTTNHHSWSEMISLKSIIILSSNINKEMIKKENDQTLKRNKKSTISIISFFQISNTNRIETILCIYQTENKNVRNKIHHIWGRQYIFRWISRQPSLNLLSTKKFNNRNDTSTATKREEIPFWINFCPCQIETIGILIRPVKLTAAESAFPSSILPIEHRICKLILSSSYSFLPNTDFTCVSFWLKMIE